jgi:hypothetical protein
MALHISAPWSNPPPPPSQNVRLFVLLFIQKSAGITCERCFNVWMSYFSFLFVPKYNKCIHIQKQKWITFTYIGNYIHQVTKLLKHITFKHNYKYSQYNAKDKHENAGIYNLTCTDCQGSHIGWIGGSLNARHEKHIRSITNKKIQPLQVIS